MRAIAVATISFGLVDLPVRVYPSVVESKSEISFNLLHAGCGSRVKQKYACETCKKDVERDDMIKGYEFAKNRYAKFSADELKVLEQLGEGVNQGIAITEFVDAALPFWSFAHIEHCYYLGPNAGSEEVYATLVSAMVRSRRTAIATYTTRGRAQLVMICATPSTVLTMVQLHYAQEVRDVADITPDHVEPNADLIMLAEQLITRLSRPAFKLEAYVDEHQRLLQEQIQQKIDGQEIAAAPTEARPEPIVDLLDALKASLKAAPRKSRRRTAAGPSK